MIRPIHSPLQRMLAALPMSVLLSLLLYSIASFAQPPSSPHSGGEEGAQHEDVVQLSGEEQAEFGIEVATAAPGTIRRILALTGEIHPNDDRLAHLVPRYDGIVTEVKAHEGDHVLKGQVMAMIESNETLTPYPLRTMIDGTVIAKHITLGESASPERVPFIVADLSTVWLNLNIYQRDLDLVRPGQRVDIRVDGKELAGESRISYVSPIVDKDTRTAIARVVLDNAAGVWRPGMFVAGLVEISRLEVAVKVPTDALFTVHGQTAVFVQEEHGFEARPVQIGEADTENVQIVAGLRSGERFVTRGGFTLKAELEKSSLGHGHAH